MIPSPNQSATFLRARHRDHMAERQIREMQDAARTLRDRVRESARLRRRALQKMQRELRHPSRTRQLAEAAVIGVAAALLLITLGVL